MDLRNDPRMQPPDDRRSRLLLAVVGNLVGMGMVTLAFRVRWFDSDTLDHPFPIFLAFGTLIIVVSTTSMVRILVHVWRVRRWRD